MDTTTRADNLSGMREHEALSAVAQRRRHDLARLHAALDDQDSTADDGPAEDDLFATTRKVLACEERAARATQAWNQARRLDRRTYDLRIAAHRSSRETVRWCSVGSGLVGAAVVIAGWWAGFLIWWQCVLVAGMTAVAVGLWAVEAGAGPVAHERRRHGALGCLGLGVVLLLALWSGGGAWWFDSALLALMIFIAVINIRGRVLADDEGDEAIYSDGLILVDSAPARSGDEEGQQ